MTYRTLSVSAGYMNAFELRLWITESSAEFNGICQVFFKSCRSYAGEHGKFGEEIVNGLLVVHHERKGNMHKKRLKTYRSEPLFY
jgi:hypothetical protein